MKTLIAIAIAAFSLGAMAQGHEHGGHEGQGAGRQEQPHHEGGDRGFDHHEGGPQHNWDQGQYDRAHNWQQGGGRRWHDGQFHEGAPHFEPRRHGEWQWRGNRRVWIFVNETCVLPDWDFDAPICLEWQPF